MDNNGRNLICCLPAFIGYQVTSKTMIVFHRLPYPKAKARICGWRCVREMERWVGRRGFYSAGSLTQSDKRDDEAVLILHV